MGEGIEKDEGRRLCARDYRKQNRFGETKNCDTKGSRLSCLVCQFQKNCFLFFISCFAEDYAATVGAQHFQTSAKLNKVLLVFDTDCLFSLVCFSKGLEETFVGLTKQMMSVFPDGGVAKKSMALSGAGPGCFGFVVCLFCLFCLFVCLFVCFVLFCFVLFCLFCLFCLFVCLFVCFVLFVCLFVLFCFVLFCLFCLFVCLFVC